MQCPACGEMAHERARFCARCGAPLPDASEICQRSAEAERRRLSVMLCDLVGSTPLSGRLDPEELAAVTRSYQSRVAVAIARFGGYLARYVGDGVLVISAGRRATRADCERAVRAALAVLSALEGPIRGERLQVHIGVATGVVVVGDPPASATRANRRRSVLRQILLPAFRTQRNRTAF